MGGGRLVPMTRLDRITTDPAICHGKPTIRGCATRSTRCWGCWSSDMTIEDALELLGPGAGRPSRRPRVRCPHRRVHASRHSAPREVPHRRRLPVRLARHPTKKKMTRRRGVRVLRQAREPGAPGPAQRRKRSNLTEMVPVRGSRPNPSSRRFVDLPRPTTAPCRAGSVALLSTNFNSRPAERWLAAAPSGESGARVAGDAAHRPSREPPTYPAHLQRPFHFCGMGVLGPAVPSAVR